MDSLFFELPTGLRMNGEVHKEVELLKTNGVAEKIFTKRISDKPFTWQGYIVSAAVKRIGNIEIGAEVRKKYLEDGSVTIPLAVMKLPLAEVNSLLVEIHRRVWVNFIPKQEVICKNCGRKIVVDIDLDRIDYSQEDKDKMKSPEMDFEHIVVDLKDGFIPPAIKGVTDKEKYLGLTDVEFNRITFRVPLLEDAINQEKYFSDSITFWRRIAMDCLVSIEKINSKGEVIETLPKEFHTWYGLRILNEYLSAKDLRTIRNELIGHLPTLPFVYEDTCPYCELETPMVMEVSNFFSE
mgnify:CR=1 FL=1